MKHYSFSTFLVDDANREVHDLCLAAAQLEDIGSSPVVILGEEGSGKTHLLYAVVNQVRASSVRAGLAYVTPHNVPDQVRALIADPSPLDRSPNALLLVDQLELADRPIPATKNAAPDPAYALEELGAIVRIFVDRGHRVLIASNVHPGRLRQLPAGLQQTLSSARIVLMAPLRPERRPEFLRRLARQEAQEWQARQVTESGSTQNTAQVARIAELEGRLAAMETRRAELEARLEEARDDGSKARSEASELLTRAQGLLEQIEANRVRFAAVETEHRQQIDALEEALAKRPPVEAVEAELEAARLEARAALDHVATLEAEALEAASAREALEHEVQTLRTALNLETATLRGERDEIAADRETLKDERDALASKCSELAMEREALLAEQEALKTERDTLAEERLALVTERDALRAERDRLRGDYDRTADDLHQLLPDLERAKAERDTMRADLDAARAECDMISARVESALQEADSLRQELEALRVDAAAQVAEANAQAGELERRMAEQRTLIEELRQGERAAAKELGILGPRLSEIAVTVSDLARRFADHDDAAVLPNDEPFLQQSEPEETTEREPFSQESFNEAFREAANFVVGDAQTGNPMSYVDGDVVLREPTDETEGETAEAERG